MIDIEKNELTMQKLATDVERLNRKIYNIESQLNDVNSKIEDLRSHIDNGFKKDIINTLIKQTNDLYAQVLKQTEIIQSSFNQIVQNQSDILEKREDTKQKKILTLRDILLQIFGTGGIIQLIIDRFF